MKVSSGNRGTSRGSVPPTARHTTRPLVVGLTGGIGAGKSTVARMLEQLGAFVVDADVIARRVLSEDPEGVEEVIRAFGREVLDEHGEVDRARLASRVFGDRRARKRLELIVHPKVQSMAAHGIEEAARLKKSVVVFDAALLVETGASDHVDRVIVVTAPESHRVGRLADRDGVSKEDATARMKAQLRDDERVAAADWVVDNRLDIDDLNRQVEKLWSSLHDEARHGPPGTGTDDKGKEGRK